MNDAQQARNAAATMALLSDGLNEARTKDFEEPTKSALFSCITILDAEHDRLIEEAADLAREGEGA